MPLPARFLARLRRLPLRLRGRLGGGTEGLHPSKFKGAGLTFVENRPYVPGDDPRFINWPLTARTGEPILKRFESSRDLVLWLVVDPSPSMFLGDPVSPLRWALELCGAAFATLQASGDRLGLIVPGDDRTPALRIAPKRGRIHGLRILETLAERGPSIPTAAAWREALGHWGEHGKGGSVRPKRAASRLFTHWSQGLRLRDWKSLGPQARAASPKRAASRFRPRPWAASSVSRCRFVGGHWRWKTWAA